MQCFANELNLFTGFARGQAAQRGRALCRALRALHSTLGASRAAAMRADPKRGDVGVRVPAADAPLRRTVISPVGSVELVQGGADGPRRPVLAPAQAEDVAEWCGEVDSIASS